MRMIYVIIGVVFVAVLLIACAFIPAMPADPGSAKVSNMLADKYGGLYIFNKKFYFEILEKEKQRKEYKKNTSTRRDEIGKLRRELYNHILSYDSYFWGGKEGYREERQKRFTDKEWLAWSKQRKKYLSAQIQTEESDLYYYPIINYIKEIGGLDAALKEMDVMLDGLRAQEETDFKFISLLYEKALFNYAKDEIKRRYPDYKEVDEAIPQTLSNGCRYYINKGFVFEKKPEYAYYENKFREYLGAENYDNILKPFLQIDVYYECNGKKIPLAFLMSLQYIMVKYGLFGDEGRGFSIKQEYFVSAGTSRYKTRFFLIDDKFVKFHEINGEYIESKEPENDK